jgi:hypothetical protein
MSSYHSAGVPSIVWSVARESLDFGAFIEPAVRQKELWVQTEIGLKLFVLGSVLGFMGHKGPFNDVKRKSKTGQPTTRVPHPP